MDPIFGSRCGPNYSDCLNRTDSFFFFYYQKYKEDNKTTFIHTHTHSLQERSVQLRSFLSLIRSNVPFPYQEIRIKRKRKTSRQFLNPLKNWIGPAIPRPTHLSNWSDSRIRWTSSQFNKLETDPSDPVPDSGMGTDPPCNQSTHTRLATRSQVLVLDEQPRLLSS